MIPLTEYKFPPENVKLSRLASEAKQSYPRLSEREPESFDQDLINGEISIRTMSHAQVKSTLEQFEKYNKLLLSCLYASGEQ